MDTDTAEAAEIPSRISSASLQSDLAHYRCVFSSVLIRVHPL